MVEDGNNEEKEEEEGKKEEERKRTREGRNESSPWPIGSRRNPEK